MIVAVTPEQLDLMRHATGHNYEPRHKRNWYLADLRGTRIILIRALVQAGLMAEGRIHNDRQQFFTVTDAGIAVVLASKPPKPTRAQKRYQAYLRADTGLSFREYMGWARRARGGHAG